MENTKQNKASTFLQVYPELQEFLVDFIDNSLGGISVDIVHAYLNKCIHVIIENDALFAPTIDLTTYYVTSSTTELVSKFKDIGTNLSPAGLTKEKQQKQNLLIKSLKSGKHAIKNPMQYGKITASMMLSSDLTVCDSEGTNEQEKKERGGKGISIQAPSDAAISSSSILHQRQIKRIKENRCISLTTVYNWMVLLG